MTSRTGNRGFTLIEVLVASVILFAGLGAVLRAYSMAVEALGIASETLAVSDLFREKAVLVELQSMASPGSGQDLSGSDRRGGVDYAWNTHSDRQTVTPRLAFQKTTIKVVHSQGGRYPHTQECEWALFRDPP